MMKITFLGTSHGVPAADRYCSSTLIEVNGCHHLIDAGAPVIDLLLDRGIHPDSVKALFTTHLHGDHVDGLHSLIDLFTWYYTNTSIDVYLTEQKGIDCFTAMLACMVDELAPERVRLRLMTQDTVYQDENLRVTPFPTRHLARAGRPAYSYLVQAEGKSVLFSGDLSQNLAQKDFPGYALEHEVDLMVCEMAHFGVPEVQPYLQRCKAKELLFNHVYPLHKLDQINALNGQYGYPIRTVEDGDEVLL